MTKDQLQKEVDRLRKENNEFLREAEIQKELQWDGEKSFNILQHRLDDLLINRAYIEGQLEVLKRVSGLYPEIRPTREEYLRGYKDIISSNVDWRTIIPEDDLDLPF